MSSCPSESNDAEPIVSGKTQLQHQQSIALLAKSYGKADAEAKGALAVALMEAAKLGLVDSTTAATIILGGGESVAKAQAAMSSRSSDPEVWTTKEGELVRVADMTEDHLRNTVAFLRQRYYSDGAASASVPQFTPMVARLARAEAARTTPARLDDKPPRRAIRLEDDDEKGA